MAGDLAAWLDRNHHAVPVRTAVMLMHERAQVGRCDKITVDLIATDPTRLIQEIRQRASPLSLDVCGDIVALIRRDHQFHNRRRPSSG